MFHSLDPAVATPIPGMYDCKVVYYGAKIRVYIAICSEIE